MSLLCMPWILCVCGGEMLYILDQRLHAQAVPAPKAKRVLCDVAASLLDPGFLAAGALPPQPPWPAAAMRGVLERAAHASVIRLSDASMGKLFDLATAGAKCQLAAAACLEDVVAVALRHLEGAQALLAGVDAASSAASELVARADASLRQLYGGLGDSELALLRHALLRWFQDRHVRVSMLLAEGIQADDGRPLLPGCGHGLGGGTSCGGRPRIVGRVTMYCAPDQTQQRRLVVCDERTHALAALKAGPANFLCHPLPAGDNLYAYVYGRAAAAARNGDGAGAGRLGSNGSAVSVSCNDDVCGVRATFRRTQSVLNSDAAAKAAEGGAAPTPAAAPSSIDFLARLLGRSNVGGGSGGGSGSGANGGGTFHLVMPGLGTSNTAAAAAAAASTSSSAAAAGERSAPSHEDEQGGEDGAARAQRRRPGAPAALEFGGAGGRRANGAYLAAIEGDLALDDGDGGGGGEGGLLDLLNAAGT